MEYRFSSIGKLLIVALLVLSTTFAFGQGIVTGTISGTVVDPQGAVVSGATITAKDAATNREFSSTSDATGAFALRGVPVGTYTVTISAPNFKRVQVGSVQVFAGRVTAMGSRSLEVGGGEEVVDVEGTAPLVESTSSQVSTSFESKKVADLPFGANAAFDALALLTPGMASAGEAGFSNTNGADLSANGQRGRSNNFQIDGQSNNDNSVAGPSLFVSNTDIIAEFQVVTNNFSAEYGRNMGSIVNYVTKSGTNNFHGSGFWYHRNNFFHSMTNLERQAAEEDPTFEVGKYIDHRYGGTLGGPVVKDKLWFFGSVQHWRLAEAGQPYESTPFVQPTPAGMATLNATFPGNPAVEYLNNFGPWAFDFGNPTIVDAFVQTVTGPGGVTAPVEFSSVRRFVGSPFAQRDWSGRGDWQVTDKDRFFVRYMFQGFNFSNNDSGLVPMGVIYDVPGTAQQIGLDWSRSWTSHFINQLRFSYSRADFGFEGAQTTMGDCTRATIFNCSSQVTFDDLTEWLGMLNNLPQGRLINNTQYQDNASWVMGRHTLKFGGEYVRQRSPNTFLPNINGRFTYSNFDNFLQGNARTANFADGPPNFPFAEQDLAFYFQDDWRIKDNLTLNLGLRWEWNEQAINLLNEITTARETGSTGFFWNPALPLEDRTVAPVPEDRNNFGPNFGFAWTPRIMEGLFGRDKTVIRGGYRIAYDPAFYNIHLNMATAAPMVNTGATSTTLAGFPLYPSTGAGVRADGYLGLLPAGCADATCDPRFRPQTTVASDFRNPYTQMWSLGVQRQVTSKIAFETRYVGNHTIGNFQTRNANPDITFLEANFPELIPAGVTRCTDPAAPGFGRINCNRFTVRERLNGAYSIYHAMQNRLDIQNWRGLTSGLGYTWSKTIDNVSEIFAINNSGASAGAQNVFDLSNAERGLSQTHFPHIFTAYWIYELPWFKNQEGIVGHILGGWQVNGTYRFQSGQPWTPRQTNVASACDISFTGTFLGSSPCRPILNNEAAPFDMIGQVRNAAGQTTQVGNCTGTVGGVTCPFVPIDQFHWLINNDAAALYFGSPFLGVGRNTEQGQSVNNVDFGVFKNTKITEQVTVQFQFNTFNLFNRQFRGNFSNLVTAPSSFGNNLTRDSNRRYVILGLKLIF